MQYFFRCIVFLLSILVNCTSYAVVSNAIEQQANSSINELYHILNTMPNTSMAHRIDWISSRFKNKVYILGALGEGPNARYDQFPLYRTDGFDCDTYVNTVLALALGHSLQSFQQCLQYMRYKNGEINYLTRNHFTSIDWNLNNQKRGLLKDITLDIKDEHKKTVAQLATALINKPGWYQHKTTDVIRVESANQTQKEQLLLELKTKGAQLETRNSKVPYLPFTALFNQEKKANLYLFSQIPNGAIIEIIRPSWDLRAKIGTFLDISHLGFAVWINHTLYFRQASSQYGKIVDVPLIDYLKEATSSPTIKGINVQIVVPDKAATGSCAVF